MMLMPMPRRFYFSVTARRCFAATICGAARGSAINAAARSAAAKIRKDVYDERIPQTQRQRNAAGIFIDMPFQHTFSPDLFLRLHFHSTPISFSDFHFLPLRLPSTRSAAA